VRRAAKHACVRVFFSLFGLILGLAIATIAGGMSDVLLFGYVAIIVTDPSLT
jgi:hypothetical protein